MEPKVPVEEPQSDESSRSSSECGEPNEESVETDEVDTEEATERNVELFGLFADVISEVPDWTEHSAAVLLLPTRASEKLDYETLKVLRDNQARYVHLLSTIKESYIDAATESDLTAAKRVLQREVQKLSFLDCRLEIYTTIRNEESIRKELPLRVQED